MGMDAGQGDKGKRRLRCGTGHRTYAKCGAVMVHQRERLWLLRAGINRNGDKETRGLGETERKEVLKLGSWEDRKIRSYEDRKIRRLEVGKMGQGDKGTGRQGDTVTRR